MSSVSAGEWKDEKLHSTSFKALRKFEYLFLEDKKIAFTLNSFFIVVYSFFMFVSLVDAEGSVHDSTEGEVRILGRKGVDAWFSFEVDVLIDEERLGKVK